LIDVVATSTTLIVTILHVLTWVVFFYLNILLSPTFIFDLNPTTGAPGSFMDLLNDLWMFSRDLVNIVFAFALVGVAVVTIVMAKKDFIVEHWQKFVLAIIFVNFSWLFPRLILDAANVTAATVYSIPSLIATNNVCRINSVGFYPNANCQLTTLGNNIYRCDCFYVNNLKLFIDTPEYNAINGNDGWDCPLASGVLCYQRKVLDPNAVAGHAAILNGLIVNHARLQSLASIPPSTGGTTAIDQTLRFLLRELMVVAFHVMLLFPLFALFIAFLIRIPVLWLTIAAMPFYFLGWVIPEKLTGGYTQKIIDLFLKAAFLPAIVGIPLSVGFIMVNAGTNIPHNATNRLPGMDIVINLLPTINTVSELLWMLISMGVVWVGVFAVLKDMDIMGKGSEAINAFGKTLGGIAVRLPLAAPIIPGIGGKSILALPQMAEGIKTQLKQGARWDDLNFGNAMKSGTTAQAAKELAPQNNKLNDIATSLKNVANDLKNNPGLSTAEAAKRFNAVTQPHGITIDENNLQSTMNEFITGLKNNKADAAQVTNIQNSLNDWVSAVQKRTTPAAPPPAGAPPNPAP